MAIKIEQTFAQIGLKTSLPQFKLQIREPRLEIREQLPAVQISQENVQIRCDATQCRAEIGLLNPVAFSRQNAQEGFRESMAYIGRVAQKGDMMARIDKYDISSVMAQLGAQAFEQHQFNVDRIPKSPVEVEVIPAKLQMDWQLGQLEVRPRFGDVSGELIRGKVDVFLRQKASIAVEYMGENVDAYR